jgi:hypothetical protein
VKNNKRLTTLLIALFLTLSLFGAIEFPTQVENSSNDVLSSTIPIMYGDYSFRESTIKNG